MDASRDGASARTGKAAWGLWGTQMREGCGKSLSDLVFHEESAECGEPAPVAIWLLPLMERLVNAFCSIPGAGVYFNSSDAPGGHHLMCHPADPAQPAQKGSCPPTDDPSGQRDHEVSKEKRLRPEEAALSSKQDFLTGRGAAERCSKKTDKGSVLRLTSKGLCSRLTISRQQSCFPFLLPAPDFWTSSPTKV